MSAQNFVELDPVLSSLIDHPRHIGYVYDVYGEQLKLQLSEMFLRTPSGGRNNKWHPDGARALPYGIFSPILPCGVFTVARAMFFFAEGDHMAEVIQPMFFSRVS